MDVDTLEKDIETLSEQIRVLQENCEDASNRGDPEGLSKLIVTLARVGTHLGRKARYAQYIARNTEHAYKAAREKYKVESMESGKSASFADTQRYLKSTDEHKAWSEVLLLAEQATDLSFHADTFLKMAQSRLSLIKNDVKNS